MFSRTAEFGGELGSVFFSIGTKIGIGQKICIGRRSSEDFFLVIMNNIRFPLVAANLPGIKVEILGRVEKERVREGKRRCPFMRGDTWF